MDTPRSTASLIVGLGFAQLCSWGALFYAIAVIGEPMRLALGVSQNELFGCFAFSTLLSGVLAPWAGRLLDRSGGRRVLSLGASLGALGFALLAIAHRPWMLLLGWTVSGVAMALGLYDTCFAAVAYARPLAYRRTVTGITLVAGFSSTVLWPAAHYLLHWVGWRATTGFFALLLAACVPIYAAVLPEHTPATPRTEARPVALEPMPHALRTRARLLAAAFAGTSLIAAALSAHLVTTLRALHFSADHAVWIASSIGVMQVLGRLLEVAFAARHNALQVGFATFAGLFVATLLLLGARFAPPLVFAFALVYGVANGLMTIVKAALPIELFGLANVGALLGSFGAPSLVARALAPLVYAAADAAWGVGGALLCLAGAGFASLSVYALTLRSAPPTPLDTDPGRV